MNRKAFHIGPGAASLMLIVVVLAMSMLSLLTLMSARTDARLSLRAAQKTEEAYALSARAEISLARLDAARARNAALPEGMTRNGEIVSWEERLESGRVLYCRAELLPGGVRWIEHRLETERMEEEESTWNFWSY